MYVCYTFTTPKHPSAPAVRCFHYNSNSLLFGHRKLCVNFVFFGPFFVSSPFSASSFQVKSSLSRKLYPSPMILCSGLTRTAPTCFESSSHYNYVLCTRLHALLIRACVLTFVCGSSLWHATSNALFMNLKSLPDATGGMSCSSSSSSSELSGLSLCRYSTASAPPGTSVCACVCACVCV